MNAITLNTCRICLETEGSTPVTKKRLKVSLADMIRELTSIQIELLDNFPSSLCKKCVKRVWSAYSFRNEIVNADIKLRDIFNGDEDKHYQIESLHSENSNNSCSSVTTENNEFIVSTISEETSDVKLVEQQLNSSESEFKAELSENISIKSEIVVLNEEKVRKRKKRPHGTIDNSVEGRTCKECGRVLCSAHYMKLHLAVHTDTKPYKCEICGKNYASQSCLNAHKEIHSEHKAYICEVCSKQFGKNIYLKQHMVTHLPESAKAFQCDVCSKAFHDKRILKRHKLIHDNIKPYVCGYCGNAFNQQGSLQRHHKTVHLNIKNHICSNCGKTFSSNANLIAHFRIHTGEKPYECQYCDAKFNQSTPHVRHTQIHVDRGDPKRN